MQELSLSSVVEDDVTSSLSNLNITGQKVVPHSPSDSHIMSIGQLLESVSHLITTITPKMTSS